MLNDLAASLVSQADLVVPFLLSLWIAWGDVRTHRIPNYLTLGSALAGLGFQLGAHGWPGLLAGFLGLLLGFSLLFLPYLLGGMGAGDVKALAALGAWLGPTRTFYLFLYMGISGGVMALAILWWRGLLWAKIRQGLSLLWHWLLFHPYGSGPSSKPLPKTPGFHYGPAIAAGMALLCWRSFWLGR